PRSTRNAKKKRSTRSRERQRRASRSLPAVRRRPNLRRSSRSTSRPLRLRIQQARGRIPLGVQRFVWHVDRGKAQQESQQRQLRFYGERQLRIGSIRGSIA